MGAILQSIPQELCYIDGILVTGKTDADHLRNLEAVLELLQEHGMHLKKEKCSFLQDSVEYLGHLCERVAHVKEESRSRIESTQASERLEVAFIPESPKLLCEIHSQLVINSSPPQ